MCVTSMVMDHYHRQALLRDDEWIEARIDSALAALRGGAPQDTDETKG